MSTSVFYRTALNRTLSERTKGAFEMLLESNEHIEKMMAYIVEQIAARRTEVSEKSRQRSTEIQDETRRAEGTIKTLVTLITSEMMLIEMAYEAEQMALKQEREMYETGDPQDMKLVPAIIHLREGSIRYLKSFRANMAFDARQKAGS